MFNDHENAEQCLPCGIRIYPSLYNLAYHTVYQLKRCCHMKLNFIKHCTT